MANKKENKVRIPTYGDSELQEGVVMRYESLGYKAVDVDSNTRAVVMTAPVDVADEMERRQHEDHYANARATLPDNSEGSTFTSDVQDRRITIKDLTE